MREVNLFLVFLERLNKSNIRYMVTGSVAGIIYGEPRVTHDIDLVLELQTGDIPRFVSIFPTEEFYCPPLEVIKTEISKETRGHFNLIHHKTGFKADIYPMGQDELHEWAMSRRNKVIIENQEVWLAPPEYVIIRKLEYFKEGQSPKHLRDVRKILDISGDNINIPDLEQKISTLHLVAEWDKLKNLT